MKRFTLITILLLFLCSCLPSCAQDEETADGISIVATIFPQYDFAKSIVGDKGNVELLLPPGADSHSFELTADDVLKINKADILIYVGPSMEIWVDNIIDSIDDKVRIVNLSEGLELSSLDSHAHDSHGHNVDPHIWTSPVLAKLMLEKVFEAVCDADPDNEEYYSKNYNEYFEDLSSLDGKFRELAEEAESNTLYFSGKFAFGYFVSEYGFDYVAPFNSCSDLQVEALASVANLINEMKSNGIRCIFYEEFASEQSYSTIASETGAEALLLHSAHNISKDDLENGVTYIDIMNNNLSNLRKALG